MTWDLYQAWMNSDGPEELPEDTRKLSKSPGRIADQFGYTAKEVNGAIHEVKQGMSGGNVRRNPDVQIDLNTGEAYPEKDGGGVSDDSIGNILDHLP